jgi:ATP-binding cassette subfamily F protein 3
MSILTANKVGRSFGADDIFDDISVDIPHGARIALVGPNGAGKTTLLNLLLKRDEPSAGVVNHARGLTIGFLPQRPDLHGNRTIWEEMLTAFEQLLRDEHTLADLASQMAAVDRPDHAQIVERYGKLQEQFEAAGGYAYETKIKQVLTGLSFSAEELSKPLGLLSGGQKTRAYLARLLLEDPDLLVLDEPTNHLDIQAVEWLEGFLNGFKGAVLVVSHDRYFMDHVAKVIWELDWGTLETYNGNYSAYLRQRGERHERRWAEFETQQERIAKEEEYIRRNMAGQNTRQAKGRLKRLDRLKRDDLITRPREARAMHLRLTTNIRSGDKVLMTRNLRIGYPDSPAPLFEVPDLTLYRGEVAAIIGGNGAGKTTFLKTLLGQIPPRRGEATLGAQVKIGYFAQAHELLNGDNTVLDEMLTVKDMLISEMRSYLAPFLFTGEDVYRKINTLSGGERGRVALAKLALDGANLLLLDEPTNHLDIPAQEVLQAVLTEFPGTILLVSHDRYLIDALATRIWVVQAPQMQVFEGTYAEYIAVRDEARQAELRAKQGLPAESPKTAARNGYAAEKADKNGASNAPVIKLNAQGRPMSKWEIEKRTIAIEQEIHSLEVLLVQISGELGAASAAGRADKVRELGLRYSQTQTAIDEKMVEWEELLT